MTALQHAGVYLSFLGLAAVYTWPLATNLGGLLPPNGDPRLFSWVLLTIFGNLTTRPALLFHGNAFYPFGNTLSFAEPLLVPALVAGPLHAWTGNPVLAYNVTLLLFWALSGCVVNGLSGFVPAPLRDLSQLLSAPDAPFPAAAQAALQRIYPLRYLVVRLTDHHLAHAWQPTWQRLRRTPPPFLRHRGTYGGDDLYEILPAPEQGLALERWVSYDFLVAHPLLETSVRPIARRPGRAAWVELTLNDRRLTRVPLDRPRLLRHRLEPPYHRAAPNVIRLTYGYERVGRRRPGADIGTTGVRSPVDLVVLSGGQSHGGGLGPHQRRRARAEPSRLQPGRARPGGPGPRRRDVRHVLRPAAVRQLAQWVEALPPGSIVAGAVRDEASGRLDRTAIRALGTLGIRGDLRGRFRDSHAFVGVRRGARHGARRRRPAADQSGRGRRGRRGILASGHPPGSS